MIKYYIIKRYRMSYITKISPQYSYMRKVPFILPSDLYTIFVPDERFVSITTCSKIIGNKQKCVNLLPPTIVNDAKRLSEWNRRLEAMMLDKIPIIILADYNNIFIAIEISYKWMRIYGGSAKNVYDEITDLLIEKMHQQMFQNQIIEPTIKVDGDDNDYCRYKIMAIRGELTHPLSMILNIKIPLTDIIFKTKLGDITLQKNNKIRMFIFSPKQTATNDELKQNAIEYFNEYIKNLYSCNPNLCIYCLNGSEIDKQMNIDDFDKIGTITVDI